MKHVLELAAVVAFLFTCNAFRYLAIPPEPSDRSKMAIRQENIRQFSVRSLPVATTVVAVLLGLFIILTH